MVVVVVVDDDDDDDDDFEMKRDPLSFHIKMGWRGYTLFKKFVPCSILLKFFSFLGVRP